MKKKLTIIAAVLFVLLLCFYMAIPFAGSFQYGINIKANNDAVQRCLVSKAEWKRWWPGAADSNGFSFSSCHYSINKITAASVNITVISGNVNAGSAMQFFPTAHNNSRIIWQGKINYDANPVTRITGFFSGLSAKKNISTVLDSMKSFFDNADRVYGIAIRPEKVNDSTLIALQNTFNHFPATKEIYSMVDSLRNYTAKYNALQTDSPMLNVLRLDALHYQTMVALPVNKILPGTERFLPKNMVLGNILTASVYGGVYSVTEGERQIANFVKDYDFISPAKPFQSLIVNRLEISDTSKWVTKLYYPVY